MLARGYVVFLIGSCRSGKTYLLKHATPGKIIDGTQGWKQAGGAFRFEPSAVPEGAFSIDELTGFDALSLRSWIEKQSPDRKFIVAAQTRNDFDQRGLGRLLQSMGHKILILELI